MVKVPKETYLKYEPIECLLNPPIDKTQALEKLYQVIVTTAATALDADACSAFLVNEDSREILQVAGTGHQEKWRGPIGRCAVSAKEVVYKPKKISDKLGMTAWIASTGQPFLARTEEDFYNHPHHRGDHDSEMELVGDKRIRTFLGVPIRGSQQDVIGVIKAERYTGTVHQDNIKNIPVFSENDEVCLSSIALAAGRCWSYLQLAMSGRSGPRDAVTAWTSDVISMAASAEPDLSSFANVIAKLMAVVASADSSSIFLLDRPTGSYLMQVGGYGYQKQGNLMRSYSIPTQRNSNSNQGLTTHIAMTGVEVYLPSYQKLTKHQAWRGQYDVPNFREKEDYCVAFLGIPLQVGGTTLGVLKLENNSKGKRPKVTDPFPDDVRRQVSILSQSIALCIVRLRTQTTERYADMERATELINDIMYAGGDLEGLAQRAIQGISELVNAEACALFVLEDDGSKLVQYPWGAYGYAKKMSKGERREYMFVDKNYIKNVPEKQSEKVGLTVWIAATEQKFVAKSNDELKAHLHHLGTYDQQNFDINEGQRCDSFIGVPLRVHKELVGILKIENKKDEEGRHIPFTPADEFVFDMLASSLANAVYLKSKRRRDNRTEFLKVATLKQVADTGLMWALGMKAGQAGLKNFDIKVPDLPDDSVVARTHYLGMCGTDIHSFGSNKKATFDLIEFHEVVGEVVWVGDAVAKQRIQSGDIVVPVVRRCQEWDMPKHGEPVCFNFRPCKEASRCGAYRHPDACPHGEYPHPLGREFVGYRSRGTGKCHGFGSQFWVDTPEWLVRVCNYNDFSGVKPEFPLDFLDRLVLVEPLAVVWKMKREIENVRAVRPFTDRMLTLGVGPIGWLATAVMRDMYPGLDTTAVDYVPTNREWIRRLRDDYRTSYKELDIETKWHPSLNAQNNRFDIVVEATGNPQDVITKAIEILAPNGVLVLLSVIGREGQPKVHLDSDALNAIVKKNAKIIGSVNESRDDFENAVSYLRGFHSKVASKLDPLINTLQLDPPTWSALKLITDIRNTLCKARTAGPKIVLKAPLR
jgi:threonine dehydrogenase-like Zn-dependent dehydrogenase